MLEKSYEAVCRTRPAEQGHFGVLKGSDYGAGEEGKISGYASGRVGD